METLSQISTTPEGARLRVHQAALVVDAGPDRDLVHILSEHPVVIGRGETADLRLADSSISREHLVVHRKDLQWYAHDLGSKNGSKLRGVRFEVVPLEDGAVIELGDTRLRFRLTPTEVLAPRNDDGALEGILGRSPTMKRLLGLLEKVAPLDLPVLLLGESGTGKERLAHALHQRGRVPEGPWRVVDSTLLGDPQHMRSELFGHSKGAFTGAEQDREGAFVQANGGTLFLDEIAELPLDLQPQLLRVLQEGEVRPLGSEETHRVRVRVVSATNRDLPAMVARGEFRQDLFYRLSAITLDVPPLRDRGADVVLLAEHFLPRSHTLSREAREALSRHPWPGNVRELEQVMRRAVALAQGTVLEPADLRLGAGSLSEALTGGSRGAPLESSRQRVQAITDEEILEALRLSEGNRAAAARSLGMGVRTFFRRLAKLKDA